MTVATITVTDLDLAKGSIAVAFDINDELLSDTRATGAALTALFISTIFDTSEFKEAARQYRANLIEAMVAQGFDNEPKTPGKIVVTIEDQDRETGRISNIMTVEGINPNGEDLPTPALSFGAFIHSQIYDMDFRMKLWAFAQNLVRDKADNAIGNAEKGPITLHINDDEAAYIAA